MGWRTFSPLWNRFPPWTTGMWFDISWICILGAVKGHSCNGLKSPAMWLSDWFLKQIPILKPTSFFTFHFSFLLSSSNHLLLLHSFLHHLSNFPFSPFPAIPPPPPKHHTIPSYPNPAHSLSPSLSLYLSPSLLLPFISPPASPSTLLHLLLFLLSDRSACPHSSTFSSSLTSHSLCCLLPCISPSFCLFPLHSSTTSLQPPEARRLAALPSTTEDSEHSGRRLSLEVRGSMCVTGGRSPYLQERRAKRKEYRNVKECQMVSPDRTVKL